MQKHACLVLFLIIVMIGTVDGKNANADEILDCEDYKTDERVCMQCNIYFEARGLSNVEQLMVGLTTLERVKSSKYPDTICDVIWQRHQFSWTIDGLSDKIKSKREWESLNNITDLIMLKHENDYISVLPVGLTNEDIDGMMYYHAHYVSPKWAQKMQIVKKYAGHVYYKEL